MRKSFLFLFAILWNSVYLDPCKRIFVVAMFKKKTVTNPNGLTEEEVDGLCSISSDLT